MRLLPRPLLCKQTASRIVLLAIQAPLETPMSDFIDLEEMTDELTARDSARQRRMRDDKETRRDKRGIYRRRRQRELDERRQRRDKRVFD